LTWVQLFLEKGANPNYIDPYGNTPVSQAIIRSRGYRPSDNKTQRQANRLKIIPLLIANGGNLTIRDSNNERPLIKEQLFKNAIYDQLMKPFEGEEISYAVVWTLLMPSITLFSMILNQGDGTVRALENNAQQNENNKSYYLPKELWIKIFSWVLSDKLTRKPALLHLLP
jgi:ankyrin repeat protein